MKDWIKPVAVILLFLFMLFLEFAPRQKNEEPQGIDFEEKIMLLEARCDELSTTISHLDEEFTKIYCYFENEFDVTYSDAYQAMLNMNEILSSWGR